LNGIFTNFKNDVLPLVSHLKIDESVLKNWHKEVALWYNKFLDRSRKKIFLKRGGLYLYGNSNAGK
jgi:hypothetical protein